MDTSIVNTCFTDWKELNKLLSTFEIYFIILSLLLTVYFSYQSSKTAKKTFTAQMLDDFAKEMRAMFDETRSIFLEEEYTETINKEVIRTKMQNKDSARKIRNLLNKYENLCRNVNENVYDEKIVRLARGQNITNVYLRYKNLILIRREEQRPSWGELEKLGKKWMRYYN